MWQKLGLCDTPIVGGEVVDQLLSDFRHVDPFRRYSRLQSKIVRSRAEFLTFFALPNFNGRAFQKLYPSLSSLHRDTWPGKVSEDTPTIPEVIGANTLNFRLNFKCSRLNFLEGGPRYRRGVR